MNHTIFKRIALTIAVLAQLVSFDAYAMLQNIKNTYNILNDDYKRMSLVHGAIAWETGFIRRLYDFGQAFPFFATDVKRRQLIISGYDKLDKTHMTARLIHALFYRVPGSTSETDFGTTKQLGISDETEIAKTVARVLVLLETLKNQLPAFDRAVEFLGSKLNSFKLQQKLLLTTPLSQPKPGKYLVDTAAEACRKLSGKGIEQARDEHGKAFKQFSETLKALSKLLHHSPKNPTGLLKPAARQEAEMANVLVNAVRECDPNSPDALFMPNMPQIIFAWISVQGLFF